MWNILIWVFIIIFLEIFFLLFKKYKEEQYGEIVKSGEAQDIVDLLTQKIKATMDLIEKLNTKYANTHDSEVLRELKIHKKDLKSITRERNLWENRILRF